MVMNILFVCYANITRSFMAERILRGMLKEKQVSGVEVSSAGLINMEGASGDPIAAEILLNKGFDGLSHQSRLLTESMLEQADKILVMEEAHRRSILEQYLVKESKIHLLKTLSPYFNSKSDGDINDCYRKSPYHYRLCFSEIYEAIEGLVKCI
jgi:protein-tyrosine-phosphatase